MPRIFISRVLNPNSPFHHLGAQWQLENQSLLQFTVVPVRTLPTADWYFFYSRKGVTFLLQQGTPPPGIKLACLGQGAAEVLQAAGYDLHFVGDGNPERTATKWKALALGHKVVFVQARQSRSSVQQLLDTAIESSQLVVYDNRPKESFSVQPADYLIFTSPMNFTAYYARYGVGENQRVIGIGETTAVTFSAAAVKEYRIAKVSSEAALVECLINWEAEYPI